MSTFRERQGLVGIDGRGPTPQVLAEYIADVTGSCNPSWIHGIIDDAKYLLRTRLEHEAEAHTTARKSCARRRKPARAEC